jgi:hypothetical protein
MIFFLNYDGTLTRQDTGRIYQGSTAVPEIKVLSGVSSASSVLEVAFTLPNGLVTQYFPLTQQGEYEQDGVKAYLWSLDLATGILANVTEQVGKVGVSVRQVNVINNTVVASYTATFDVEYSALPYTPTEYTPADTQELIDLLGAYYNQNQVLIDSIKGDYDSVIGRLDEQGEDITNIESDIDKLEELTDKPLLINITTDVETGVGTKYYNDGTIATFEIGTDVATSNRGNFMTEISFLATSLNWTQESDGTYSIVFSPATTERKDANCIVAVDKLDGNGYNQTANGVLKGSDGSLALYGVLTPFDGKLLVLAGGGAGTKIWTLTARVGAEINELVFDTASTPNVYGDFIVGGGNATLIKVGEIKSTLIQDGTEFTTTTDKGLKAQNLDTPPQAELVWYNSNFNEVVLNYDENKCYVDGVEYSLEDAEGLFAYTETIVYRQYSDFHKNNGKPTGWLVDGLTFDKTYIIEEVNNYDKWEEYIGVSDKSTLYNKALIGDYYVDKATGKWYVCVGKTDTSIDWQYLFTGMVSVNLNGTQTSTPKFFAPTSTRSANSNGSCWVLTPNGYNAPEWEQMTLETADNLTYTIKIGGKNVGSFTLTKEVFLDSVSYNPETKKLTFTYNTESGKASVDIDLSDLEEVQNALIATNETEFLAYQTAENVGKLVTYRGLLYIITESGGSKNPTAVGDTVTQIYFNTTKSAEEVYNALLELDWNNPEISGDAQGFYLIDNGGSHDEGTKYGVIAINMGGVTGIQTIVEGGGGLHFAYSTTVEPSALGLSSWGWQGASPVEISPSFNIAETKYKDIWGSWLSASPQFAGGGNGGVTAKLVNKINSITCDGTSFRFSYKVGENTTMDFFVPIDYVEAELVDTLTYNDLTDVPIVVGDLDTITPVANTYYKHNGASETTYTKGVIYFYDGSTFAPVTGGGGGGVSDVQINGTSIVSDGVANIPNASHTQAGVVSTGTQVFKGTKQFNDTIKPIRVDIYGSSYFGVSRKTGASNVPLVGLYPSSQDSTYGTRSGIEMYQRQLPTADSSYTGYYSDGSVSRNGNVSYFPFYAGTLLSAPSTWSTGTSGSVTLASSGLYEFKVTLGLFQVSTFVNWDGTNPAMSPILNDGSGDAYILGIVGGVVMVSPAGTEDVANVNVSYRKIGIA